MTARKLTDAQIDAIRIDWEAGETAVDIAAQHGVSVRHVNRLCETRERASALPLDQAESAEQSVREFLASLELQDAGSRVLASASLVVARKLDRADARSAAGLASRLQDLVVELRRFTTEPDQLDLLRRQRALRRAGVA